MKYHSLTELLKEKGLKKTFPRLAVLEVLSELKAPISAQDLHKKLKNSFDLATIYRNLETLKQTGLVFKEERNREKLYYMDDKEHHHLVCKECGKSECLPCEHIFRPIKGFKNITHKILLEGVCKQCLA